MKAIIHNYRDCHGHVVGRDGWKVSYWEITADTYQQIEEGIRQRIKADFPAVDFFVVSPMGLYIDGKHSSAIKVEGRVGIFGAIEASLYAMIGA